MAHEFEPVADKPSEKRVENFVWTDNFFLDCREVSMMVLGENGQLSITLKGNSVSQVFVDHVAATNILTAYRSWVERKWESR